jgi:hypothetical protein
MLRRRGGPGVLSTMARTAVIAGTATKVSNAVNTSAAAKAQAAHQQHAAQQAAQDELVQMREQLAAQETVIDSTGIGSTIAHLKELAQLKDAGMLTEEEFSLAKAKLLAG